MEGREKPYNIFHTNKQNKLLNAFVCMCGIAVSGILNSGGYIPIIEAYSLTNYL